MPPAVAGYRFCASSGIIRMEDKTITWVVTQVSHGCPVAVIEATFAPHAQTVRVWAAGAQAEALHHTLIMQPCDV